MPLRPPPVRGRQRLPLHNALLGLLAASQKAAQEVNDLRTKVVEQERIILSLQNMTSPQSMSDESGKFWFEDLQPGYYQNASGERIMQPEFSTDDTQSKVIVRGWDPEKKEAIISNHLLSYECRPTCLFQIRQFLH